MRKVFELIREHAGAYLVMNLVYYGLVIVGIAIAAANPDLQELLIQVVGEAFLEGPLSAVTSAYLGQEILLAMALTFAINLVGGSFFTLTLPSLIVPFSGFLIGFYRALLWGVILSPTHPELTGPMIPHTLTLLLEGQAYVVTMFAVWLQGMAFLKPRSAGAESHWRGYLVGLRRTGRLYVLVAILLAVAAIYEVLELIYIVPRFFGVPAIG